MRRPTVTVAIPVYNGEREIAEAIQSVLAQSFSDFELLVSNDASTDATLDVVASFEDDRIRVINGAENLGYIGNFNRCVAEASGVYLKILCHDDVLRGDCLSKQVAALEHPLNSSAVICTTQKRIINDAGKTILWNQGLSGGSGLREGSLVIRQVVRAGRNLIGETSVVLARTEAFRAAGSFATKYTLDLNMWIRMLAHGDLVFIREPLSDFRVTPLSGTAAQSNSQASQTNDLIDWARSTYPTIVSSFDVRIGKFRSSLNQTARRLIFSRSGK